MDLIKNFREKFKIKCAEIQNELKAKKEFRVIEQETNTTYSHENTLEIVRVEFLNEEDYGLVVSLIEKILNNEHRKEVELSVSRGNGRMVQSFQLSVNPAEGQSEFPLLETFQKYLTALERITFDVLRTDYKFI